MTPGKNRRTSWPGWPYIPIALCTFWFRSFEAPNWMLCVCFYYICKYLNEIFGWEATRCAFILVVKGWTTFWQCLQAAFPASDSEKCSQRGCLFPFGPGLLCCSSGLPSCSPHNKNFNFPSAVKTTLHARFKIFDKIYISIFLLSVIDQFVLMAC